MLLTHAAAINDLAKFGFTREMASAKVKAMRQFPIGKRSKVSSVEVEAAKVLDEPVAITIKAETLARIAGR